jgi:hypothetical protein
MGGGVDLVTPGTGGPITAKETQVLGGYPAFSWRDFAPEHQKYLADYNPKDNTPDADGNPSVGVVYLNLRHPVFVQEFTYWSDSVWPKADPQEVKKLVMNVYGQEAVAHVVHAQRLNGSVVGRDEDGTVDRIGPEDVDELTTKQALTAALLGLVNVEQRLLTQGGGLFGSRANAS